MRLDVITIFPEYLSPLDLSLIGKARELGLIDLRVHDLRDFTHDRHRTVDDTPYGGGAGMVMRPEPWGEALAQLTASEVPGDVPHLLVPSPSGVLFTQTMARQLASEPWLAFACGRYEGIDERVIEHAQELMPVTVVSVGDFVLGGGEVAVLAMVEAITRLVPGVIGNGLPGRGVPRGWSAGVPGVHQAAPVARTRRTRGSAVRSPRADRALEAGRATATHRAAQTGHDRAPGPGRPGRPGPRGARPCLAGRGYLDASGSISGQPPCCGRLTPRVLHRFRAPATGGEQRVTDRRSTPYESPVRHSCRGEHQNRE